MNKEKLQQIADYIKTVPQQDFNMECYKTCVLGHSTDKGLIEYSVNIFGSDPFFITHSDWQYTDNTPIGASKRIEYLIKHGTVPYNWRDMMKGKVPLCY